MPTDGPLLQRLKEVWRAGGTGGLTWHTKALAAQAQWRPTVDLLEVFLSRCGPTPSHVLLIGASAGWMMPSRFLQRFVRIDAYDIDPLAGLLFKRRHGQALRSAGVQLNYHCLDALAQLPALLAQHPHACVWFDNVLGQLRFRLTNSERTQQQLNDIRRWLKGRTWGSVHDAYSGPVSRSQPPIHMAQHVHTFEKTTEGLQVQGRTQTRDAWAAQWIADVGGHGAWLDHLTRDVLPVGSQGVALPWAFGRQHAHWLEAGWVNP